MVTPRVARNGRRLGTVAAALVLLVSGLASAQPGPPSAHSRRMRLQLLRELRSAESARAADRARRNAASLRDRFAEQRGEELLTASSASDRIRGIRRLAGHGSDRAIKALVEALRPGSLVRSWPQSRLEAVRALAPHADDENVRERLIEVLGGSDSNGDAVSELARATAALALARAGTDEAISALLTSVLNGDRAGEYAQQVLRTHRPKNWKALTKSMKRRLPERLIVLLGDLGDPRALGLLRRTAKGELEGDKEDAGKGDKKDSGKDDKDSGKGSKKERAKAEEKDAESMADVPPAVRAKALLALAKLGDGHAARYGRRYLKEKDKDETPLLLRVAATRALVLLDTRDAAKHVGTLLAATETRQQGLTLAEESLSPALLPTLKAMLSADIELPDRTRAAHIVWRIGGPKASDILVPLLAQPKLATAAAFGLSSIRHPSAGQALARALAAAPKGAARRLVLRAHIARLLRFGERSPALQEALQSALKSEDPADRAVGAFGLTALSPQQGAKLLDAKAPEVATAAAGALAQLGQQNTALAGMLEKAARKHGDEAHHPRLVAGSAVLLRADTRVATATLARWAQSGSPLAAPASFRLARRDSRVFRRQLRALLDASDPLIRLHVAWGLAGSPERDATSLLARRYRFEADVRVRRALLRALAARPEAQRTAPLQLAAQLDPDPGCRALAQRALNNRQPPAEVKQGRAVVWLSLRPSSVAQKAAVNERPALLVRDDGTALPVVAAPDGIIIAGGLPAERRMSLQLAPSAAKGKP